MTDRGAVATVWAAHRLGVDVPGGVSVVGVGNTEEGERVDRPGLAGQVIETPWEPIVRGSSASRLPAGRCRAAP